MHYSGAWDTRALEIHPDWARQNDDGVPDGPARAAQAQGQGPSTQQSDMTCRLSPYDRDLMIPQMLELIDRYDIDGFWVDGENWASKPCWCPRCRAEFARRTGLADVPNDPAAPHWAAWLAFHRDLFVEHVAAYADAVHARKPDCTVCSNWMSTMRQPEPVRVPVDYLSGDFDWTWGADRAAVEGRLLDCQGKSWDLMAWAFTKTGPMRDDPPWVEKGALQLCQEVAEVVALGGAVMIYDVPQRSGWLTDWHHETIAQVADFFRARQDPCFKSTTLPQAAVLHLASHLYAHNQALFNNGEAAQPVEGAVHALLETHRSTDILTEAAALTRLADYPLVVVPEQTNPTPALSAALAAYAESGGHLLLTGPTAATDHPDLVGATPTASPPPDPAIPASDEGSARVYLPVDRRAVPVGGPWQAVVPATGTEIWTHCLDEQEPARNATDQVAVTHRRLGAGTVTAVHGPIFRSYFRGHYPLLRAFIGNLIDRLAIDWLVTLEAPPRLELILRRHGDRLLINLINRGSGETLSPRRVAVEEIPPVEHVTLRVRLPQRPVSITALPADRPLDWDYAAGLATIRLPRVDIHTVLAIA